MSTLQVANIHLETTGNNRIQLVSANTVALVVAGSNVFNANTTQLTIEESTSFTNNYFIKTTTLSAGNNHNINCASGNYFVVVANSSAQNVYFTSAPTGVAYSVTLRFSNGAGGNTISWANTPRWPGATAPTPSTNNDIWLFITDDGGTNWRGDLVQKDSR